MSRLGVAVLLTTGAIGPALLVEPAVAGRQTIDTRISPDNLPPGTEPEDVADSLEVVGLDPLGRPILTNPIPDGSIILPLRVAPPTAQTPFRHIQIVYIPPDQEDPLLFTIDPPAGMRETLSPRA